MEEEWSHLGVPLFFLAKGKVKSWAEIRVLLVEKTIDFSLKVLRGVVPIFIPVPIRVGTASVSHF